jgi:hypothetical protein
VEIGKIDNFNRKELFIERDFNMSKKIKAFSQNDILKIIKKQSDEARRINLDNKKGDTMINKIIKTTKETY